mgnify:CR=1 FL=1
MNVLADVVVQDTRNWLERAVIGLNLCPFAKAVHVKGQVHYAVSEASDARQLLADLSAELDALVALDATERETTLLMVPNCLADFLDFNDFLAKVPRADECGDHQHREREHDRLVHGEQHLAPSERKLNLEQRLGGRGPERL